MTDGPEHIGPMPLAGYVMRDRDHFVATLRQAWLTRGPSQAEIARRARTSRPTVASWLNGTDGTVVSRAFDLAHALGYDLALIPRENTND